MFSATQFGFILFALVFSAFIKGSLGMGFSTICLAILANVIELKTAISIMIMPSLLSNLLVMIDAGNFRLSIQQFWLMLLMAMPGMLLGLLILMRPDNTLSMTILALVLICYGVWGWHNHHRRIANKMIPKLNPVVGLLTGIVNGATGSQIFPIMPYLLSLNIAKEVVVQTINLSFTLCSVIMLAALITTGKLDAQSMITYSLAIVPVMVGVWAGNRVRKWLPENHYRQAVMLLIVVLGALLLFRTL